MKQLFFLGFVLVLLPSCATKKTKELKLQEMISQEESRSLLEIKHHSKMMIDSHPELTPEVKKKLELLIDKTLTSQQILKEEESKLIQLMLSESFAHQLNSDNLRRNNYTYKKNLEFLYQKKMTNILSLVSSILEMSKNKELNPNLEKDMMIFIRDLR